MNKKISLNNERSWKDPIVKQRRTHGIALAWYGMSRQQFYKTAISGLIFEGLSASAICSALSGKASVPTIKTLCNQFGTVEEISKLKENGAAAQRAAGLKSKGVPNVNRGKTYEQIFDGDANKIAARKKASSDWMKANNPRKFATRISRPQRFLFDLIKQKYPSAVMEHRLRIGNTCIFLDIAVPEIKLNVEYDGSYWHSMNNANPARIKDVERDKFLTDSGWRIIRIAGNGKETPQQLQKQYEQQLGI